MAPLGERLTIDDGLADLDAAGVGGAPAWSLATLPARMAEVAAAGALAGVLMILLWLRLRPDLSSAVVGSFFWIKAAYPAVIAACALVAATLFARGARGGGRALAAAGALAGAMLIAAGVDAWTMGAPALRTLYWPNAAVCVGNVLIIAAPMLALIATGLRDVDLERQALTGLACGLFCGGVAAVVDGLHCWQTTYAFVGPWFTLAMLLSGGVGAGLSALLGAHRRRLAEAD